ncbi:MAG: pyridoxal-phosphate dependent enzyme [Chloroflexota bacterium]|nr:pyridoxal-phosphate dependent enzyme [Chloroflexota bacterium]
MCGNCGKETRRDEWGWRDGCGGAFDIILDLGGKRFSELVDANERSIRRYAQFLPVEKFPVVHQGWTPIVKKNIGGVEVNFKLEYLSIGGSFKDRGAYISVAKAKELDVKGIIVDSSGNAGIGFSLMGLLSGIDVDVFIPRYAPEGKKSLLRLLEANIHEIDGDRMDVNQAAVEAEKEGLVYVGHWWNPYFIEGVKTIAYETYEQIGGVDCVVVPVGSGTILLGLYKGYEELVKLGVLNEVPRVIAVQACGYSGICEELGARKECIAKSGLADGIAITDPPRRRQIVEVVTRTKGCGIIVNDEEIKESLVDLRRLGFIVEPTSATAYAALEQAIKQGLIKPGSKVLLPLTGSGLKLLDELVTIRAN